jgi:Cof subfamily protein (haloacid dehalogenase superfamily)
MKKNRRKIRIVALDLDGTTLGREGRLTRVTAEALGKAMEQKIHIVVATGRCFSALPAEIADLEAIRYIITSNGAKIRDRVSGRNIYNACIAEDAVERICGILSAREYTVEAFIDGRAYISRKAYEDAKRGITAHRRKEYILETRTPVEDLFGFVRANSNNVENFNVLFEKQEDKAAMRPVLESIEGTILTSSFPSNWELGGAGANKGAALKYLRDMLGVEKDEVMAVGDSPNDIAMLRESGLAVAVANATEETKSAADHLTLSNEENGVAAAIKEFVL